MYHCDLVIINSLIQCSATLSVCVSCSCEIKLSKSKHILDMYLLLQEGSSLKSKGKASSSVRILVLTWRSLLVMSREWKYYWLRLILYMLLTLCIGTVFSGLGHSLSSVVVSFFLLSTYLFKDILWETK